MAQLVARGVWDAEVASSSLVAPTIQGGKIKKIYFLYLTDAEWKDFVIAKAYHYYVLRLFTWSFFIYACLNRTCETSQGVNASSSLVAPTIQGGKIKKIYFLYLTDAEWKDFVIAKAYHYYIAAIYMVVFLFVFIFQNLSSRKSSKSIPRSKYNDLISVVIISSSSKPRSSAQVFTSSTFSVSISRRYPSFGQ